MGLARLAESRSQQPGEKPPALLEAAADKRGLLAAAVLQPGPALMSAAHGSLGYGLTEAGSLAQALIAKSPLQGICHPLPGASSQALVHRTWGRAPSSSSSSSPGSARCPSCPCQGRASLLAAGPGSKLKSLHERASSHGAKWGWRGAWLSPRSHPRHWGWGRGAAGGQPPDPEHSEHPGH